MYDEAYRKAGKMDVSNFSVQFDPTSSGLIQAIESQLVPTKAEKAMSIKAEIYKLNVYGQFNSLTTDGCRYLRSRSSLRINR